MAQFEKSRWADSKFSKNYREMADIYLPLRNQFVDIAISLYAHFISNRAKNRVLDLGCGDGYFMEIFLKNFSPEDITLVDGSREMLEAAKKRLVNVTEVEYIEASFQAVINSEFLKPSYDFIHSSLAIHHIPFEEKKQLYTRIHNLLTAGGCFVHYDVIVPPSAKIEEWYLSNWREWINQHPYKKEDDGLENVPSEYKGNPDNLPDTLESHLEALKETGFKDIDCYFKYGIFAIFGGFK